MDLCAPAIGDDLKSERERLGLSIADVAKHTRIKATYLSAIEAMKTEALPSLGYVLGYIRTYARYLGLDGEAAVMRYKAEVAAPRHIGWRERAIFIPKRKIMLPRGLMSAVSVVICAIVVTFWYGTRSEASISTPTQTTTLISSNAQPTIEQAGFVSQAASLSSLDVIDIPTLSANVLTVKAVGPSWVQAKDKSGNVIMSRIMVSGETWQTEQGQGITLSARDGGVVQLYRGNDLIGALGINGKSLSNVNLTDAANQTVGLALVDMVETP